MIIHKIEQGKIEIDRGQKVVRRAQYQNYLSSQETRATIKEERQTATLESKKLLQTTREQGHLTGQREAKAQLAQQQVEFCRRAIYWTSRMEKEIFASLSMMLEKILGEQDKDELTKSIIRAALASYKHLPELKLRVAPTQKELALGVVATLAKEQDVKFIVVEEDERLEKGACLLESPLGSVDASLDSQLASLKNMLSKMPAMPLSITPPPPPPPPPSPQEELDVSRN